MLRTLLAVGVVVCLLAPLTVEARITRIEITNTSDPDPDGYITITGTAYGEVDPTHPLNTIIQDIELAPRNERGMVEYSTEIVILKPPDGGNGLLFYDVVNRGLKVTQMFFPKLGSILRQRGNTVVWSGWHGELAPIPPLLNIQVPVATHNGSEITGRIRIGYVVTQATSTLPLGGPELVPHKSYEPVDLAGGDAVLTRRMRDADPPIEVPKEEWAYADCKDTPFPGSPNSSMICLKDGFDPNYIYELIYTAKNPLVLGLGFAATRDLMSFLRHAKADDFGTANPVAETIRAAVVHGASDSSRFARTFLHLGFNADEDGRIVFEGMNPYIGPARIPLNVRFGQPSRFSHQHSDHLRPGWESPFTWMPEYDPLDERVGWLLGRCLDTNTCPKIIQATSSWEYWNIRASLNTTDALGRYDAWLPRNVRMYLFSGAQHAPAAKPDFGICQQLSNPNDWTVLLRALLVALERWVLEGEEPPPSQIPTVREGTLVAPDELSWPEIPGVKYTGLLNTLPLVDYGPEFNPEEQTGILQEPPKVVAGKQYAVLVPQVDADGNEIAGIRSATVQAPLGTYTGWNLRRAGFSEDQLCPQQGSFIPFATTRSERDATGDLRPSLEERYGDHDGYVDAVREAANRLVAQRFLLQEDAAQIIMSAEDSDVLVPPETENQAPVAVITPESQTITSLEAALDGSKSHDPDGDPITYSWKATGTAALIMGANTATARVQFQGGTGDYTFELTVTDDQGATGTTTTKVAYFGP